MIFITNKYTNIYYNIISSSMSRTLPDDAYTERHHIIPKSLGGSNRKDNIAVLTAREHFICHRLLTKMTTGEALTKMKYALYCISHVRTEHQQRFIPNARLFEQIKIEWQHSIKGRVPWNKGVPMTDEQKLKLRNANLGKKYTRSPEYLAKQSKAQTGISKGKGRVSNRKGIPMSAEQKEKIRATMLATLAAKRKK